VAAADEEQERRQRGTLRSEDSKRQVPSILQMSPFFLTLDTRPEVYHKETAYYAVNQNSWLVFGADSA
jgi:hypothetical protein